ncbi:MAG TPA: hypothetical protein GXX36_07330 [Clostridiaceae bacterium]|nr:hypothetical protein [Clostridiaceae bacterium]
MEDIRSSVSLNLSNQANNCRSKNSSLSQYNYLIILGLGNLNTELRAEESVPVRVKIDKSGELTISGLDIDMANSENVQIYSDKKVTTSED